jgi:hypothetical protein
LLALELLNFTVYYMQFRSERHSVPDYTQFDGLHAVLSRELNWQLMLSVDGWLSPYSFHQNLCFKMITETFINPNTQVDGDGCAVFTALWFGSSRVHHLLFSLDHHTFSVSSRKTSTTIPNTSRVARQDGRTHW